MRLELTNVVGWVIIGGILLVVGCSSVNDPFLQMFGTVDEPPKMVKYQPDGERQSYRGFSILPPQEGSWKMLQGVPEFAAFIHRKNSKLLAMGVWAKQEQNILGVEIENHALLAELWRQTLLDQAEIISKQGAFPAEMQIANPGRAVLHTKDPRSLRDSIKELQVRVCATNPVVLAYNSILEGRSDSPGAKPRWAFEKGFLVKTGPHDRAGKHAGFQYVSENPAGDPLAEAVGRRFLEELRLSEHDSETEMPKGVVALLAEPQSGGIPIPESGGSVEPEVPGASNGWQLALESSSVEVDDRSEPFLQIYRLPVTQRGQQEMDKLIEELSALPIAVRVKASFNLVVDSDDQFSPAFDNLRLLMKRADPGFLFANLDVQTATNNSSQWRILYEKAKWKRPRARSGANLRKVRRLRAEFEPAFKQAMDEARALQAAIEQTFRAGDRSLLNGQIGQN